MKQKEEYLYVVAEEFQKELSNVLRSDALFKEKFELLLGIWEKCKCGKNDIGDDMSPF